MVNLFVWHCALENFSISSTKRGCAAKVIQLLEASLNVSITMSVSQGSSMSIKSCPWLSHCLPYPNRNPELDRLKSSGETANYLAKVF